MSVNINALITHGLIGGCHLHQEGDEHKTRTNEAQESTYQRCGGSDTIEEYE